MSPRDWIRIAGAYIVIVTAFSLDYALGVAVTAIVFIGHIGNRTNIVEGT